MSPLLLLSLTDFVSVASIAARLMGAEQLGHVFALAGQALARGVDGKDHMDALTSQMRVIVAEDRPPTPKERADWKARSDAAHALIQSAP